MDRKGFTLIELLIVIAIIGILAMVALPLYLGQQKSAVRTEAFTNLQNLRLLEEQLYADNGTYNTIDLGEASQSSAKNVTCIQNGRHAYTDPDSSSALPGFKPGSGLNFNYYIIANVELADTSVNPPTTTAQTPCFVAFAVGTSARVSGDTFAIDCNNNKNF